ncbi:FAD-dependent oxidoreductase [Pararobbsia silviterrae]|uniref:FAD-dependent oxidoreductase n=1 Tax=Pararobbsia silviterrae TaxID=1792498 RepID=A0A494XUF6_9BURK|nr:FAD-dependent oxidoreductase [Pararobbsia silviterrae]RKP51744.1 FAD-dependent oxidoreductase [Pararobbsia silviterrae]
MHEQRIIEPQRSLEIYGDFDVVVAGGGPAGIAAALAAGRTGRRTLLIERYGFLGGAGTAAGLSTFCGLHSNVYGTHTRTTRGLVDDILDRLDAMDALSKPHLSLGQRIQAQAYDISAYKIAAEDLLADAGVEILYHAFAAGLVKEGDHRIRALFVETKEGRFAITARIFVDATGDADLAHWSGVPIEIGDEHGYTLYPSTMFRINGVDPVKAGAAWELIPKLMAEEEARSGVPFPRKHPIVRPQRNPIEWRSNLTQVKNDDGSPVSGIDARQFSKGEIQGRRQSWDAFDFIRRSVPGFEDAYIVEIAPQLGIRETRRIVGDYQLSQDDILGCRDFDDSIGVNGWPVEAHVSGDVKIVFAPNGSRGYNQIPYRTIVPKQIENLFVVGRCASMTHDGQSSARVSGPCFSMGEAAGIAADLALADGTTPRGVDIWRLQDRLRANGVFLGDARK